MHGDTRIYVLNVSFFYEMKICVKIQQDPLKKYLPSWEIFNTVICFYSEQIIP
jgi:hypothetical protein